MFRTPWADLPARSKPTQQVLIGGDDPKPRRLPFDLERVMRTEYQIDRYQDSYFVIDSFEHLMRETAPDFTPIYARIRNLPVFAAGAA